MTTLIINGAAIANTSLGARRYYAGVAQHLAWPGDVEIDRAPANAKVARLRELTRLGRGDALYWSPSHRGPLFARNHIVTVLDCINIEHTYRGDWRLIGLRAAMGQLLQNSVAIATISEATRDAVLRNFDLEPTKVVAIPGPVALELPSLAPPLARAEPPFALMVTNDLPHKNAIRAAAAFAKSRAAREGVRLRIVGRLPADAVHMCSEHGVVVEERRGVDDETLAGWYAGCTMLLAPSLDEGLDLPVAEALAYGAEVVCSDIPVHREFYEGVARFFDPYDIQAMTGAIDDALDGEPLNAAWSAVPRRTFADVASDYRQMFERAADAI